MKATAVIERGLDGTYGIFVESNNLPFGVLGDGKTVAEAIDDFYASLEDMREYYEEIGKEFPKDLEFEFKYDTASFLQQYAYAFTLAGLERITGINQRQLSHYINGIRKPSEKTIKKIEERLHTFGSEIAAVRFA
ncbi:MAG: type II toxin-antitoxin system HicB family antitoxin [Rikenellaceae bacterium]|jgi:predicted RNase H-like HicB family nuclease|nr:type II toxin-antitoxin system HicB family antitoxin [Rikenellaceae bacterium]